MDYRIEIEALLQALSQKQMRLVYYFIKGLMK